MPFSKPKGIDDEMPQREVLKGIDTKYMKLPEPKLGQVTYTSAGAADGLTPVRVRNRASILNDTEAIAEELDDLLFQFQSNI